MVVVFHDAQSKTANDDLMQKNFVEYGRRLEKMVGEIKVELDKEKNKKQPAMAANK